MRPRVLLVPFTVAGVAAGLVYASLPLPPASTVAEKPFSASSPVLIDLDRMPSRPILRATLDYDPVGFSPRPDDLTFYPHLRQLVTVGLASRRADHHTERRWDLVSGRLLSSRPDPWRMPDRTVLASADGRVWVVSQAVGLFIGDRPERFTATLFGPHTPAEGVPLAADVTDRDVFPLAVAPDGRFAYVADGYRVRAWDTTTGKPAAVLAKIERKEKHEDQGLAVLTSPNGRWVAVVADTELFESVGHCGSDSQPLPYSLENGFPHRVRVYETSTWACVAEFTCESGRNHGWIGERFVTRNFLDGVPPIFNDHRGDEPYTSELHDPVSGRVERFSRDPQQELRTRAAVTTTEGGRFAAAWYGRTVALFDLISDHPPRRLVVGGPVARALFTPDTRYLLVFLHDGTVSVYDLAAG